MLRGASAAVPTILTLSSGAALAATSNLISTVQTTSGDVMCLKKSSTEGPTLTNPNLYDLGDPPYGEVVNIPSINQYRIKPATGAPTVKTPQQTCLEGGVNQYKTSTTDWTALKSPMPQGVMVSNASVASFGTRIIYTDITTL